MDFKRLAAFPVTYSSSFSQALQACEVAVTKPIVTPAKRGQHKKDVKAAKKVEKAEEALSRMAFSENLGKLRLTVAKDRSYVCGEHSKPAHIFEFHFRRVGQEHSRLAHWLMNKVADMNLTRHEAIALRDKVYAKYS